MQEGVVFVLSGFVNPERSTLRSQALTMGATYQPDWNAGSTLLICAFPNTPKFRQVETNGGTIISKEWITECYAQKKLVDIEQYLMHAGKPWRKSSSPQDANRGKKNYIGKALDRISVLTILRFIKSPCFYVYDKRKAFLIALLHSDV
jgi:DNA-repair protein XRCC1